MFPLVVAGQMLAAIVVEHYGLFGVTKEPFSLPRIGGVLLVVLGVVVLSVTRQGQTTE
jgi:transporter family-2 protein